MWLRIKTDIDPSGRMCRLHPARYIKEDDVMPRALSQSHPDGGSSPSFCSGRKLGDLEQALLWSLLQEDPQCPSRLLLDEVVAQLTQAIETHKHTHPDDDFALLHHREQTLRHRFQALFFAPLFGIQHLTEFDTR